MSRDSMIASRPGRKPTPRRKGWHNMRLRKAIDLFIQEVRMSKSRATATAYESDLNGLAAMAGMDTVLAFTVDLVRTYFTVKSSQGVSMATLHRRMAAISEFAKWGIRQRLWATNPIDQLPRIRRPRNVPRPFTKAEATALLALELSPVETLVRALFFFTGLRVTPICGIKIGDISYDPPQIRALVKGNRVQVVKMHPALRDLIFSYVTAHTDLKGQSFLLQTRTGRPFVRKQIARMTARWGLVANVARCTPHRFRHSFGTALLEAGVDIRVIQEAMGHADIQSTMLYTAVSNARLDDAISRLPWGSP